MPVKRRTIELDEMDVSFVDNRELRDEVFRRVLGFYLRMEAFSGETIMQSDEPLIESPVFLSDLADDVFKFEVDYHE